MMCIVPYIYNGILQLQFTVYRVPYIYCSIQYTDNIKSIVHDNLIMFYQSYSAYYLKLWLYWHYIPTSINVEKIIFFNMLLTIIGTGLEGSLMSKLNACLYSGPQAKCTRKKARIRFKVIGLVVS